LPLGFPTRRSKTAPAALPQESSSSNEEVFTSITTPTTPTSRVTTQESEPKTATEGSTKEQQRKLRRERRSVLPAQQRPSERISFAALGRMILQRTGVPISHYEPLTALQGTCLLVIRFHFAFSL
ncbi:hypothetical protein ANCCAN_25865, partial [Ancylostoma caninum]